MTKITEVSLKVIEDPFAIIFLPKLLMISIGYESCAIKNANGSSSKKEVTPAARVMGREMSKIAKKNELLFSRLVNIIDSNILVSQNSDMAKIMVEYYDNTIDDNVQLLKHLRQGFTE